MDSYSIMLGPLLSRTDYLGHSLSDPSEGQSPKHPCPGKLYGTSSITLEEIYHQGTLEPSNKEVRTRTLNSTQKFIGNQRNGAGVIITVVILSPISWTLLGHFQRQPHITCIAGMFLKVWSQDPQDFPKIFSGACKIKIICQPKSKIYLLNLYVENNAILKSYQTIIRSGSASEWVNSLS